MAGSMAAARLATSHEDPTTIFEVQAKLGEGCPARVPARLAFPTAGQPSATQVVRHSVSREEQAQRRACCHQGADVQRLALSRPRVRRCVLKRLCRASAPQVLELEGDSVDLKKEIDILASCHSEYVVGFRGAFEKDGQLWVRARMLGGAVTCSLADALATAGRLRWNTAGAAQFATLWAFASRH
jgi:hypothetical protein